MPPVAHVPSPEPLLTRGEVAALLLDDLQMAVEHDRVNPFVDLPSTYRYADALATALAYDLLTAPAPYRADPHGHVRVRDVLEGLARTPGLTARGRVALIAAHAHNERSVVTRSGYVALRDAVLRARSASPLDDDLGAPAGTHARRHPPPKPRGKPDRRGGRDLLTHHLVLPPKYWPR